MKEPIHPHNFKFHCPKCGNNQYNLDRFQATGNIWLKDIVNKKFTTVSCTRCFYTEIYKIPLKQFAEVVNFIKS